MQALRPARAQHARGRGLTLTSREGCKVVLSCSASVSFARLGTVSVRALRHYDQIGLLRPAKVDPDTGYRGYSAEQLGQLNRIVALKELGLSLAQVRQLLGGITLDELWGMLMLRRAQPAGMGTHGGRCFRGQPAGVRDPAAVHRPEATPS